jgi:hypothetical protein
MNGHYRYEEERYTWEISLTLLMEDYKEQVPYDQFKNLFFKQCETIWKTRMKEPDQM